MIDASAPELDPLPSILPPEGVVASRLRDLADAGLIFATGFAPFRGGPLHYRELRPASANRDT